ncbi:MAG: hypothetical protein PHU63_01735 [Candidatus ainarchaeum sp.]|nr:hypothetical protein [Candidatus ainarchaeum sp.]
MKNIFILLLLFPFLFSFSCESAIDQSFTEAWEDVALIFGAVFLFTIAIITIAYIYGMAMSNPHAVVFAKDELFHLFMSILIILSVFGIIIFFCYVGSFFFSSVYTALGTPISVCSGSSSVTELSICYTSQMENEAKSLVEYAITSSVNDEMDSTWIFSFNFPLMGTTSTPTKAFKKAYAMNYDAINSMLATPALISISMQNILLKSALKFSIAILLPFAILLRVFLATRQMGNILIAAVIAIQVFLPLMYAINGIMYFHVFQDTDCTNPNYAEVFDDHLLKECGSQYSFLSYARLAPQAIFLPNLTIAVMVTFLSSINKALRVLG